MVELAAVSSSSITARLAGAPSVGTDSITLRIASRIACGPCALLVAYAGAVAGLNPAVTTGTHLSPSRL
jgi:hypothetical protein